MNIGVIFTAEKRSGGTYQYSLSILRALELIKQHNYFVFNFSPDFPLSNINPKNWTIVNLCSKKNSATLQKRELNWKKLIFKIVDRLKLYRIKIYLVEQNSKRKLQNFYKYNLDLVFYPLISEFSYLLKVPSIIAIHDLHHRLNPQFPEVSQKGRYIIREHLNKRAISVARYVFVDSKASKEDVISCYKVPADRVIVLPFVPPKYLDRNISGEEIEKFLDKYNLPKKFIFYPAQFWPHKNHQNLIKALSILKKRNIIVHLVLVGSKREEWGEFDRVMDFIKKENLEDQIHYFGYVSNNEMGILYKLAIALVMPALIGPTYIPVLEAWYMNCPALYSDIRGCREQAGDAALLFDPNNPQDIAEKIELIWANEDLREELIYKGQKRFNMWTEKDFNKKISQIVNDFEKNHEKLINKDKISR